MDTRHASVNQAAPLECRHCSGFGSFRSRRNIDTCERCDGTGHVRCETRHCDEPAVRTALGDADIKLCEACGVVSDRDYAAWLATQGAEVAA